MLKQANWGRRLNRVMTGALIGFFAATLLLSNPFFADAFVESLQIYPALSPSDIAAAASGPPTAIVILSAGRRSYAPEFGGETVDELGLERVRYGAALARQTQLPILVTGGLATTLHPPHAKLMAEALSRDYGITPKWLETRSATTAENAVFSAEMLKQAGIGRILLVTHAWHMKRARAAFVANGMDVIPAPTGFYGRVRDEFWTGFSPSMRSLRMSGYAIHETLGNQWYALNYGY